MDVYVSDLNAYLFCTRSVYLSKVLQVKPEASASLSQGLISHAVRRELSMRQSGLLRKVSDVREIGVILECELDRILHDVPHIYRNMLGGIDCERYVEEIRAKLLQEIGVMEDKMWLMVEEVGLEQTIRQVTPWRVEYPVKSSTLKLTGRIDKVMRNPSYVPGEIKTGSVPSGVWKGDRLQTCAYAMLLEDQLDLDEPILFGFVEYTRVQERRPVMTTERLRREVVQARDSVVEILEGDMPDVCPHGNMRKCNGCGYKGRCYDI